MCATGELASSALPLFPLQSGAAHPWAAAVPDARRFRHMQTLVAEGNYFSDEEMKAR